MRVKDIPSKPDVPGKPRTTFLPVQVATGVIPQ